MFDQFLNQFWTSFGAIFEHQTEPRIHPKTGPELDQKRAPQGDGPKVVPKTGLCSNLLFLTHSNDLLKFCKAFTQFVNEPRFGQDGPKLALRRPEMAQDGPDMALRWQKNCPR